MNKPQCETRPPKGKRNAGCSPEMAAAIVRLLQQSCECNWIMSPSKPKPAPVLPDEPRKPRQRKVRDDVREWILAQHGRPMAEIIAEVKDRFRLTICAGTVYRTWKEARTQ